MSFGEAIASVFGKYATFSGRARRSEYWFYMLFLVLAFASLAMAAVAVSGPLMGGVRPHNPGALPGPANAMARELVGLVFLAFALVNLIPTIAVSVRRLHDLNASGWWLLPLVMLAIVPPIGAVALLVQLIWFCMPGTAGRNTFGRDPKTSAVRPYVLHN